jgi:hypothetical protein
MLNVTGEGTEAEMAVWIFQQPMDQQLRAVFGSLQKPMTCQRLELVDRAFLSVMTMRIFKIAYFGGGMVLAFPG